MKLNSVNYTRQYQQNIQTDNNKKTKNPSFGNLGVGFATFIENNGFLGEFLTIDTVGMMTPRTIQGYMRNHEELGHPNYKAGREELVRELLSGPAFFYVPLAMMAAVGLLRGKSAKVTTDVLSSFKNIMKNTTADIKNQAIKSDFVDKLTEKAFAGYDKERGLVDKLADLMKKNLEKGAKTKQLKKEAVATLTALNKANSKFIDGADKIKIGGDKEVYSISSLFSDMRNYLDDFSKKAAKTKEDRGTFIDKFHKKVHDLRLITNILAVSALSAFLLIIPKLYQTDKKFPGKDGLNTGDAAPAAQSASANEGKEAVNENK